MGENTSRNQSLTPRSLHAKLPRCALICFVGTFPSMRASSPVPTGWLPERQHDRRERIVSNGKQTLDGQGWAHREILFPKTVAAWLYVTWSKPWGQPLTGWGACFVGGAFSVFSFFSFFSFHDTYYFAAFTVLCTFSDDSLPWVMYAWFWVWFLFLFLANQLFCLWLRGWLTHHLLP